MNSPINIKLLIGSDSYWVIEERILHNLSCIDVNNLYLACYSKPAPAICINKYSSCTHIAKGITVNIIAKDNKQELEKQLTLYNYSKSIIRNMTDVYTIWKEKCWKNLPYSRIRVCSNNCQKFISFTVTTEDKNNRKAFRLELSVQSYIQDPYPLNSGFKLKPFIARDTRIVNPEFPEKILYRVEMLFFKVLNIAINNGNVLVINNKNFQSTLSLSDKDFESVLSTM